MKALSVFAWILTISIGLAGDSVPPELPLILLPGVFQKDTIPQQFGSDWYGVFELEKGLYEVRRSDVLLTKVGDGEHEGLRITAKGKAQPLFLVRGIAGLRSGSLETKNANAPLMPGTRLTLGDYQLAAIGQLLAATEDRFHLNYQLRISHDGREQIIFQDQRVSGDSEPALIWAGDLNGDHRLDLIVDTTNHQNVHDYALYLSQSDMNSELMEEVATLHTTEIAFSGEGIQ